MSFEELQIEELNHIISDLKQQLNYELRKNRMLNKQLDALVELGDKISHQNEELEQTNGELQNDLHQATNEIKLLNKQIDRHITAVNDLTDIVETSHKINDDLTEENKELKFRIKMLIKVHLNSIYGLCNLLDNTKEPTYNDSNN